MPAHKVAAPVFCVACGSEIRRRRLGKALRLDTPTQYAKRKFCNKICEAKVRRKNIHHCVCVQCHAELARKRFHNGELESAKNFRRRRFCDLGCAARYHEEHGIGQRYRRFDALMNIYASRAATR